VARDATNPSGTPTVHTWTADGLPATTTQPVTGDGLQRRATTWSYDPAGRKSAQQVALVGPGGVELPGGQGGTQRFAWHANDRLATQTGRGGQTITTSYDASGNPVRVADSTAGGSVVTAGYYLDDLVRQATDATGRTSAYSYDGAGQLTWRAESAALGAPTAATYRYGDAGQPTAATDERVAGRWTFTHDQLGRPTAVALPGGLDRSMAWNPDDTLAAATVTRGQDVVADWAYRYDPLYRVVSADLRAAQGAGGAAAATGEHRYRYDDAGRLGAYTAPGAPQRAVGYDADGNRTSYGAQRFTYRADDTTATATDRDGANSRAHTYQAFGGLADDGCAAHAYDGFDRTATLTPHAAAPPGCGGGSTTVAYRYDGLDRQRHRSATVGGLGGLLDPVLALETTISHDGLTPQVVAETDVGVGAGPPQGYVLDPAGKPAAVVTATSTEHLLDDGRGTIWECQVVLAPP
jgi:YD repeat-containing protein